MSDPDLERFVSLALGCVHREFPNQVQHLMRGPDDASCRPRERTPAFYGCFDWHSAVHSHWVLAVAVRRGLPSAARAADALARSLTEANLAVEEAFLAERPAFERPYGLAWLAQLHAALRATDALAGLADALAPLVEIAAGHVRRWLPKLSHPVRSGVHSQTAFALGLWLDWARALGREEDAAALERRARDFFWGDRAYPLHLEPSGEDFLSPSLGPADLLARLLAPEEIAAWLDRTMPQLGRGAALAPVEVTDPSDGRLAHLDGLNLSRAWMLSRVGARLPEGDPRVEPLRALADAHARRGFAAVGETHYEGAHWLGTFAVYLAERRAHDVA